VSVVLGGPRPVHGELIESSWTDEWTAYDSLEEALLAAAQRVAEL